MNKIKCPHCGHRQEAYPYVILCGNCYADIKDVVDAHFKRGDGEITDTRQRSGRFLRRERHAPNERGSRLIRQVWTASRDRAAREGRRLSAPGVIFKRTFGTFFGRFWTLSPLMYLSFSFFMLIGVFLSIIGVHTYFPEVYPADPSMMPAFVVGIAACLFVFLYAQAAFIFALSNTELSLGDALTKAWQRFGSYLVLVVLIVASVGLGASMLIFPGVIAAILFSFAPFVLARENVGPIAALTKSARYVAGSWLQVLLRLAPVAIVVIFTWFFFAYIGGAILMVAKNEIAFIFIISGLVSVPITIITVFVFTIYDDLRTAEGLAPSPEAAPPLSPEEVAPGTAPAPFGLRPFPELISRSWAVYKKRFVQLTILNLISYLPQAIYLAVLLAAFLGVQAFSNHLHELKEIGLLGEYGLLFLLLLPNWMLALLVAAALVCLILHIFLQIFGVVLYLLLELAYVYVVADETIDVWGAIRKARKRLRGFFWAELYRNFIVSSGWILLVPGAVFWVWYEFTPYVFALQREEGTPLSSLRGSRDLVKGLWGPVFKQLLSLRFLPPVLLIILLGFIFAGFPFYYVVGVFLFFFSGHYPPYMFAIYSPHFWLLLYFLFFLLFGGVYLPFQKVVLYTLYKELKDTKDARGDQSA
jgi:hypothetical protein